MKVLDYFWARALVIITGIVFGTQLFFELSGIGSRKAGFEWVIFACAGAFAAALLYAATLIGLNAWCAWRSKPNVGVNLPATRGPQEPR